MRLVGSTSKSFLMSVIVHGAIFLILSIYVISQNPKIQEIIETTFFDQKQQTKPNC